jgi:hypothetical protein
MPQCCQTCACLSSVFLCSATCLDKGILWHKAACGAGLQSVCCCLPGCSSQSCDCCTSSQPVSADLARTRPALVGGVFLVLFLLQCCGLRMLVCSFELQSPPFTWLPRHFGSGFWLAAVPCCHVVPRCFSVILLCMVTGSFAAGGAVVHIAHSVMRHVACAMRDAELSYAVIEPE